MAVKFKPLQVDNDPEEVLAKTKAAALKERAEGKAALSSGDEPSVADTADASGPKPDAVASPAATAGQRPASPEADGVRSEPGSGDTEVADLSPVVETSAAPAIAPEDLGPGGLDLSSVPRHIDGRPLNMRTRLDLYHQKQAEKAFKAQIAAARVNQPEAPKPVFKPYIPEAVRKQIEAEMAAGAAASARAKEQQARRVVPQKREPWEGTNTQIIRPVDFQRQPGALRGKGDVSKVSSTVV